MDPTGIRNNEQKWKYFLSSIETGTFKYLPTNNITITSKSKIRCLATEFADKLFKKKGGTVVLSGKQDVLEHYKHLDVSKNQPETPITKGNIPPVEAEDEPAVKRDRRELFYDREADTSDVKEMSTQSADVILEEKPHIDETLRRIVIPVSDISLVSDVDIVRSRDRDTPTPSKKSDMDKSCSKWNVSNIAEYFSFDDCVTKLKIPTRFSPYPDDIYAMVQKDICRRLEIVRGIDLKDRTWDSYSKILRQLISITSIETGSRLVLDALLVPLCSALHLQFEVDKNINCNFLPNCRFDYCIRKGEHIIGCIEAKTVKSLSDTSIAQAVLQLNILQTNLLRTETSEVNISEFPVFAIVTDGHRFIYMQLKGSSLGFEHDGDRLRIRYVKEEGDFKDILEHIRFLVEGDKNKDDAILID